MSLRYKIKNGVDIVNFNGYAGNVLEKQRIRDERIRRLYSRIKKIDRMVYSPLFTDIPIHGMINTSVLLLKRVD
jgi:hypothetical protein